MLPAMPMMVIKNTWWVPFHSLTYIKQLSKGQLRIVFGRLEEPIDVVCKESEVAYAIFPQPPEVKKDSGIVTVKP